MIKTEAIILKSADSNEVDRLLVVYSEKLGKINISAKGVKKVESKLRYSIEPTSYVQVILVEGKNFLILKDAVIIDQFLNIKKDLEKTKSALKVIVLINELIAGEERDEDIWNLILKTFKNLNQRDLTPVTTKNFQDDLLKFLGYDPKSIKNLRDIY